MSNTIIPRSIDAIVAGPRDTSRQSGYAVSVSTSFYMCCTRFVHVGSSDGSGGGVFEDGAGVKNCLRRLRDPPEGGITAVV
jgi:hypothetical protein